jgi:plastocyanin
MRFLLTGIFQRVAWIALTCVLVLPFGGNLASAAPSLAPSDPHQARDIIVNIKTRQFEPATVYLQSGEKIRLILRNQDVELHAFVPISLFQNATLHVSGNGAPEFGSQGLLRILLPSKGQTEILFVPQRPGHYPFLCDLPGHVMSGTVVVQD